MNLLETIKLSTIYASKTNEHDFKRQIKKVIVY